MNADDLDAMSGGELSEVFANEVCGLEAFTLNGALWVDASTTTYQDMKRLPDYARSADAVLPWLEKAVFWNNESVSFDEPEKRHICRVTFQKEKGKIGDLFAVGTAPTFARAAVLALIRAKRMEKE